MAVESNKDEQNRDELAGDTANVEVGIQQMENCRRCGLRCLLRTLGTLHDRSTIS